jgi:hypothetical protein
VPVSGYGDLLALSGRLRQMGPEGQGLRRELLRAMNDAAVPLAEQLRSFAYLAPYLPDRYAAVLAPETTVTVVKRLSAEPKVSVRMVSDKGRKIKKLNQGILTHPLFGNRKHWYSEVAPEGGMRPGFFDDAAEEAAPEIRDGIIAAMAQTARKITG